MMAVDRWPIALLRWGSGGRRLAQAECPPGKWCPPFVFFLEGPQGRFTLCVPVPGVLEVATSPCPTFGTLERGAFGRWGWSMPEDKHTLAASLRCSATPRLCPSAVKGGILIVMAAGASVHRAAAAVTAC